VDVAVVAVVAAIVAVIANKFYFHQITLVLSTLYIIIDIPRCSGWIWRCCYCCCCEYACEFAYGIVVAVIYINIQSL